MRRLLFIGWCSWIGILSVIAQSDEIRHEVHESLIFLQSVSWLPDEVAARIEADRLLAKYERKAVSQVLAERVRDQCCLSDRQHLSLRWIGLRLQPDYQQAVLEGLSTTQDSIALIRLIESLRFADPSVVPALIPLLNDQRMGCSFSSMSKGGEARGYGEIPRRVCDWAYNVIQEIRSVRGYTLPQLRGEPVEHRDAQIAVLRRELTGVMPGPRRVASFWWVTFSPLDPVGGRF